MAKKRVCRASHCLHSSKEFLPDDKIVEVGKMAYHEDCYRAISNIKEVVDLFAKKINPNVVFSELRKVINTIVYTRGIDSGLLLFGIKYYINNRIPLNYPQGLYYVVQNKKVQVGYQKTKTAEVANKYSFDVPDDEVKTFTHKTQMPRGFSDILNNG